MLTVFLQTRNHEKQLAYTLSSLVTGAVEGLITRVIVLDEGSEDATSDVADAAGCDFHVNADIRDMMLSAHGSWFLLLEPGARLQSGWVEQVAAHMATQTQAARFSVPGDHFSFLKQFFRKSPALRSGLLIPKADAVNVVTSGMRLGDFTKGRRMHVLSSAMIPRQD